ncbi:MAG: hypothetical protein ACLR8Y_05170 [Alistipes indistinctus]
MNRRATGTRKYPATLSQPQHSTSCASVTKPIRANDSTSPPAGSHPDRQPSNRSARRHPADRPADAYPPRHQIHG